MFMLSSQSQPESKLQFDGAFWFLLELFFERFNFGNTPKAVEISTLLKLCYFPRKQNFLFLFFQKLGQCKTEEFLIFPEPFQFVVTNPFAFSHFATIFTTLLQKWQEFSEAICAKTKHLRASVIEKDNVTLTVITIVHSQKEMDA